MLEVKREVVEFVSEKYRKEGVVPSVRKILKEFGLNRAFFYKAFPGGIREVCKEADVQLPSERFELVNKALRTKGRSERHNFDLDFKKSELEAKVKELDYSFRSNIEDVKDEPFWRSRREQFKQLCDQLIKRINDVKEPSDLEALEREYKKLKYLYMTITGESTPSDKIEGERKQLAQLREERQELEKWQKAVEERLGMPLEKSVTVIRELATLNDRFGLTVEQVQLVGQFLSQASENGFNVKTLVGYLAEHSQTMWNLDTYRAEKERLKSEIEKRREEIDRLDADVSNLEAKVKSLTEEVHVLEEVRKTTSKMLNQEMELIGKATLNKITLAKMCSYCVDLLVDKTENDPRFQGMIIGASFNRPLGPFITKFGKIVKENADEVKQEIATLSFIEKLLRKAERNAPPPNYEVNHGKSFKSPTLSDILDV
jgi:archaellum component FlaC